MTPEQQAGGGVIVGRDYPLPRVDHGAARARTLALYRVAAPADDPGHGEAS
jgi:hypothetical protein